MNTSLSTRRLTFMGVMLAVTIILDMTPLGAIPIGAVSATITHIPTIITGILLGPIAGLIMGAALGVVSLLHALLRPATLLDPLFVNPLLSILPRMFIGVISYYAFNATAKVLTLVKLKGQTNNVISAIIGGLFGSMTNTVLVLSMMYIVYARKILSIFIEMGWFGADAQLGDLRGWIIAVITSNALIEAIVAAVITTAIVVAYKQVFKGNLIKEVETKV